MIRFALLLGLVACHRPDDCERAIARLDRINGDKLAPTRDVTRTMIESCRSNPKAAYDPVLRCALDAASDDEARSCIDRVLRDVVTPGGGGGGSGLNPLVP